jgi:hypothetical protein
VGGFFVAVVEYATNSSSEGTSKMSGLVSREAPLRLPVLLPCPSFFSDLCGIVDCLRGRSGEGASLVDVDVGVGVRRDDLP